MAQQNINMIIDFFFLNFTCEVYLGLLGGATNGSIYVLKQVGRVNATSTLKVLKATVYVTAFNISSDDEAIKLTTFPISKHVLTQQMQEGPCERK